MSKARELAELGAVYDSGALSNRNLIINGGMEVSQRGTSSTSSGYVSLDRFYVNQSGASTTFSQETNANPSEIGGLQKYARLNVSSSSDFCHIRQPIEDVTTVPAGTVTLSFYAKGTAPAGGLYTYGIQNFGSGGSSDVDWTAVLITSTLTSDWVRYTAQITVPSLDGKTIGAGSYFLLDIGQHSNSASTAFDLNITGVQLEVGTEATPFEHRSFGDELARCSRYFQTISGGSDAFTFACKAQGSDGVDATITLRTPLRASPTFNSINSRYFNDGTYVASSSTTPTSSQFSANDGMCVLRCTGFTGLTNNEAGTWGPVSNELTIDAEL